MTRPVLYILCKHCDHFVDDNPLGPGEFFYDDPAKPEGVAGYARYDHMENGDQEFDHDALPDGPARFLKEWQHHRPDLFMKHKDGNIGPNSRFHSRRGKIDKPLPSTVETVKMERRIKAAFKTRFNVRGTAVFEHGHWWVTLGSAMTYSVVDAEGGESVDGFDFERVD